MLRHLRLLFGCFFLQPSIDRSCNCEYKQSCDNSEPTAGNACLLVGLALLLLSLCERFAGEAGVSAGLDDRYENIMREFHPASVVAVLIGEKPPVDQFMESKANLDSPRTPFVVPPDSSLSGYGRCSDTGVTSNLS